MKPQNYSNHRRYYTPHHFILLPLLSVLLMLGIVNAIRDNSHQLPWLLFSIAICCILYLTLMLRQHYALGNQDRIIRLEFRLRYYTLFQKSWQFAEDQLSFKQIAALRFADDEEFKTLLDKALTQNMAADEIKRSIKNWQADTMRV